MVVKNKGDTKNGAASRLAHVKYLFGQFEARTVAAIKPTDPTIAQVKSAKPTQHITFKSADKAAYVMGEGWLTYKE